MKNETFTLERAKKNEARVCQALNKWGFGNFTLEQDQYSVNDIKGVESTGEYAILEVKERSKRFPTGYFEVKKLKSLWDKKKAIEAKHDKTVEVYWVCVVKNNAYFYDLNQIGVYAQKMVSQNATTAAGFANSGVDVEKATIEMPSTDYKIRLNLNTGNWAVGKLYEDPRN